MTLVVIDAIKKRLVYANAGHELPILQHGRDAPRRMDIGDLPLGVEDDTIYSEEEVDEFITPSEGWLEVIKLKQPVHPSMLDEEGKMTVSVTVQYKNLGTDEKPNWVKTSHAMTTGGPIA